MKKIELKNIRLRNFKGLKKFETAFTHNTNIYGDNATGKTTIMDAFLWILFGKDSTDRTSFEIKTVNFNGNGTPKEVEVEAELTIDGDALCLKKVYKEKWVKKRGSVDVEFAGHQTDYFVNAVPYTQKDYNAQIETILSEEFFKIITNPMYFSSLAWKQQRDMLFDMVPETSNLNIAEGNEEFEALMNKLVGKDLDGYRREVAAKKKTIKELLENIPARIDEVERSMPQEENWQKIEAGIRINKEKIADIEGQIADKSKAYEKQYAVKEKVLGQLQQAKDKLRELSEGDNNNHRRLLAQTQDERIMMADKVRALKQRVMTLQGDVDATKERIRLKQNELDTLRESYRIWSSKEAVIDENDLNCPACKRPLDDIENKRDHLVSEFNKNKTENILRINADGHRVKAHIDELKENLEKNTTEVALLIKEQKGLESTVIPDPDYKPANQSEIEKAQDIIAQLQDEYNKPITGADTDELQKEKNDLITEIDLLNVELTKRERIKEAQMRIKELEKQQREHAQDQADCEREEYVIQQFEKAKVQAIENRVNSMFNLVKWKLFETQINGAEVPTCKATYKGVPYSDLNTATKINAGIDIINVISKQSEVSAPIFVDHAESVTKLHHTNSQLIRLIVSEDHKVLTIKN